MKDILANAKVEVEKILKHEVALKDIRYSLHYLDTTAYLLKNPDDLYNGDTYQNIDVHDLLDPTSGIKGAYVHYEAYEKNGLVYITSKDVIKMLAYIIQEIEKIYIEEIERMYIMNILKRSETNGVKK